MRVVLAVFTVTGALSWAVTALVVAWAVRVTWKTRHPCRRRHAAEVVARAEALLRDAAAGR